MDELEQPQEFKEKMEREKELEETSLNAQCVTPHVMTRRDPTSLLRR